jgi:hypothetical protein
VADIDATHARLAQAGVDVSEVRTGRKPGTRVMTVRSGTCGVPTLLVQPSAGAVIFPFSHKGRRGEGQSPPHSQTLPCVLQLVA